MDMQIAINDLINKNDCLFISAEFTNGWDPGCGFNYGSLDVVFIVNMDGKSTKVTANWYLEKIIDPFSWYTLTYDPPCFYRKKKWYLNDISVFEKAVEDKDVDLMNYLYDEDSEQELTREFLYDKLVELVSTKKPSKQRKERGLKDLYFSNKYK